MTPLAATMRPRSIGTRSTVEPGACCANESVEAAAVRGRDIEEEKRRRLFGQRGGEFAMQVAVDLDHGDEQGKSEPERQHDARRQRTGAVDVGDGEPHTVERWRGQWRASHIVSSATSRSTRKTMAAAATKTAAMRRS